MFQRLDGTRKLNFNQSQGNSDGILIGQESFQGGKGTSAGLVGTGSGLDLNLKSCSLGPEKKHRDRSIPGFCILAKKRHHSR